MPIETKSYADQLGSVAELARVAQLTGNYCDVLEKVRDLILLSNAKRSDRKQVALDYTDGVNDFLNFLTFATLEHSQRQELGNKKL